MAYLTACETDVAATASFYGGGISSDVGFGGRPSTISRTSGLDGRVLCLFGGKDALIPQKDVEKIRDSLAAHNVRHEIVVYPEADHGFFCNERGSYDEAAASDAWIRVKQLFAEELPS